MDREVFNFYKIKKPLFQIPDKNKSKKAFNKKLANFSTDEKNYFTKNKNLNNKRTKSPIPIKNNDNRKNSRKKLKKTAEPKHALDLTVLSSIFKINDQNITEFPDFSNEKILNFDNFTPFIKHIVGDSQELYNLNNNDNKNDKKNNLENYNEEYTPNLEYGLKILYNDIHNDLDEKINTITFLQSFIRSFLTKKKFKLNALNKKYFEKKNIVKIINLQKNIRCFLSRLKIRKTIIINLIEQKRNSSIRLIVKKMRLYNQVIKSKKLLFIKHNMKERNKCAKYIQETFKNYRFYSAFKKLQKDIKQKYFLIYPKKAEKVELIIYLDNNSQNESILNTKVPTKKYLFSFNKLLNAFILFISPEKLSAGKYKCQFIVNDAVICDKKYPYVQLNNGTLYNIIEFTPKKKKKLNSKTKKAKKDKKNNTKSKNNSQKKNSSQNNTNNNEIENDFDELEDIPEEEDEGKSTTSKDNPGEKYNATNIFEDIDFSDEDYIAIKKLKGRDIFKVDLQKLRDELFDKKPVDKGEKIRKSSFKTFNINY